MGWGRGGSEEAWSLVSGDEVGMERLRERVNVEESEMVEQEGEDVASWIRGF